MAEVKGDSEGWETEREREARKISSLDIMLWTTILTSRQVK